MTFGVPLWIAICILYLVSCFVAASDEADCRGDDDELPLAHNGQVVFHKSCESREVNHLGYIYEIVTLGDLNNDLERSKVIRANITAICTDFAGNEFSRSTQQRLAGTRSFTMQIYSDEHYIYYGLSCHIFGCYKREGESDYYRFVNASCFRYFRKNECLSSDNNCHQYGTCHNIENGTFSCTCNMGYSGNGTHCEDIDECKTDTHNCDVNAECDNIPGGFNCLCRSGYDRNGTTCADIDECSTDTHNCDANAICTNTPGGFNCSCNSGYTENGTSCEDINECSTGTHNCDDVNADCINTPGEFNCICRTGYSGTTCEDIDECSNGTHNCDANADCINTPGGFNCICGTGYSGNGTSCEDINECSNGTRNCDVNAGCDNTPGGFNCTCNSGYTGNGTSCEDINECYIGAHNCDNVSSYCTNIPGGFNCTCKPGYSENDTICVDIDECSVGTGICDDANVNCTNTPGGFICSCKTGYICEDVSSSHLHMMIPVVFGGVASVMFCLIMFFLFVYGLAKNYEKKSWKFIHHGDMLFTEQKFMFDDKIVLGPYKKNIEEDEVSIFSCSPGVIETNTTSTSIPNTSLEVPEGYVRQSSSYVDKNEEVERLKMPEITSLTDGYVTTSTEEVDMSSISEVKHSVLNINDCICHQTNSIDYVSTSIGANIPAEGSCLTDLLESDEASDLNFNEENGVEDYVRDERVPDKISYSSCSDDMFCVDLDDSDHQLNSTSGYLQNIES